MENNLLKDLVTLVGISIALITLIKGFVEFKNQGLQKRVEQFLLIQKRIKEDPSFVRISALLENEDISLQKIPFKEKSRYLELFEELALLMNSKIISKQVIFYMFGYYTIDCWESTYFWNNINKESKYWALFKDFALTMKKMDSDFAFSSKDLHF
jgi:hypothetical protein